MAKVITFSRQFPSYHPKAGQPTYFVEKVLRSVCEDMEHIRRYEYTLEILQTIGGYDITKLGLRAIDLFDPKHHTIRAGHRFKAGDWFSPRVWSGKPYNSKQIQFAPDIRIPKTWDYKMAFHRVNGEVNLYAFVNDILVETPKAEMIASNDGLTLQDFSNWFCRKGQKFIVGLPIFDGQIICWNESIEY